MDYIFDIIDKNGRRIHLTEERLKHIQKHPHMDDPIEIIKETIKNPHSVMCEDYGNAIYFYKEFKNMLPLERYLMVSVRYLNGVGFIITSFFTNKITGKKWKAK